jgi:hypothetical protein
MRSAWHNPHGDIASAPCLRTRPTLSRVLAPFSAAHRPQPRDTAPQQDCQRGRSAGESRPGAREAACVCGTKPGHQRHVRVCAAAETRMSRDDNRVPAYDLRASFCFGGSCTVIGARAHGSGPVWRHRTYYPQGPIHSDYTTPAPSQSPPQHQPLLPMPCRAPPTYPTPQVQRGDHPRPTRKVPPPTVAADALRRSPLMLDLPSDHPGLSTLHGLVRDQHTTAGAPEDLLGRDLR